MKGLIHEDDELIPYIVTAAEHVEIMSECIYFRKYREGSLTRVNNKPKRTLTHKIKILNGYETEIKNSKCPVHLKVFENLRIHVWISFMDYLKYGKPEESSVYSSAPKMREVALNSNIHLSQKIKFLKLKLKYGSL